MDLYEVDIALDKIGARIAWKVTPDALPELRAAIARGEFGRARILAETPCGTTTRSGLKVAA